MRHHLPALLQVVHYISMRLPRPTYPSSQTHLSVESWLLNTTRPCYPIKGSLYRTYSFLRARPCALDVCAHGPTRHTRHGHARARAHSPQREREPLHSPPRSRNTPRRLRPSLSLARRVPPLARVSAEACEGCYSGRPDRELEGELRESVAKRRSEASRACC